MTFKSSIDFILLQNGCKTVLKPFFLLAMSGPSF